MKTIFNADDKNEVLTRLEKLQPDSKALWGKMNASQMLAHCIVPTKISAGEIKSKQVFLGKIFGKMAKKQMLSASKMKKSLPTDASFVIRHTPDFYTTQQELKQAIQTLHTTNKTELLQRKHPFFGKMSEEEWGVLNYMHYDHHLRQFGV